MPLIKVQQSIAAGATVDLMTASSAQQYQYLPADAELRLGLFARATGVTASIFSGADILTKDAPVTVNATADTFPKDPDDLEFEDVAGAGERLLVEVRNPTGGAIVVAMVLKVNFA